MMHMIGSVVMRASSQAMRTATLLLCLGLLAPGRVAALGGRYIDITTSGYAGSAPLTNFPLLVRLSTAITDFSYSQCRPDGADLAFYDAGIRLVAHEIDTWDTNGTSLVWVRVPEVTSSTRLRLVFGNPADVAPAFTTNGAVWADGYRAVWHLDDGTSNNNILDSTANRFGGVKKAAGSPAETDAVVGKGQLFASSYINLTGLKDTATTHTVSMWIKGSSAAAGQYFFDVETGRFMLGWGSDTAGKIGLYRTSWVDFGSTPSPNVWHHIAVCCGGTDAKLYVDGALYGVQGAYSGVGFNGQVALGSRYSRDSKYFAGLLDEVRVSSVLRPPDWIAASYSNMVPNSAFNTYSPVGTLGPALQIVGLPFDYGVANPVYGLHEGLESGHTYTCSVSRVWDNATEGSRHLCTGWTRYGIDRGTFVETLLDEAASNELVYTHTDIERLEWHFARQGVRGATSAGAGGFVGVSPASDDGYYAIGATVTATATAGGGYMFYKWKGDLPDGADPFNTVLTFAADVPRTLEAVFGKIIYVTTTGNASADGTSWATATTLANGVTIAAPGSVVVVSNGTYALSSTLGITKGIAVRGLTGDWRDVILNFQGKCRGIQLSHADALVAGVSVLSGRLTNLGANAHLSNGATVSHCRFAYGYIDQWSQNGAGIYNDNSRVFDCVIDGNNTANASVCGAGLHQLGGNALADRCVITNNYTGNAGASNGGAGVYLAGGVLRNSLIARNRLGSQGGAIAAVSSPYASGVRVAGGILQNCAVVGNIYRGAANTNIVGVHASSGTVLNCILDNNTASDGSAESNWGGSAALFRNCLTTRAEEILGGVSADQQAYLIDADGLLFLFAGSPLIDAGAGDADTTALLDMNGDPRLAGTAVDIGPVEYQPSAFACEFSSDVYTGFDVLTATLTARPSGDTAGIVYYWDLNGDGTTDEYGSDKAVVTAHFATLGTTTVSLCATNGAGLSASWSWDFTVRPSILYVVKNAAKPQRPYATWATAAATLHDAFGAAMPGSTIVLSNGTHTLSSTFALTKSVTVRGVTGHWKDVALDATDSLRAVEIYDSAATLKDLTVKRGRCYYDGPGVYIVDGGTLTNCRVTANYARDSRMHGAGVYSVNGTLLNCVIDGNQGAGGTPRGLGLLQTGSAAFTDRCIITNNVSSSSSTANGSGAGLWMNGGTVRNSLIARNYLSGTSAASSTFATGVTVEGGRLENCAVYDNFYIGVEQTRVVGLSRTGGAVTNCIICGNGDRASVVTNWAGSARAFSHCFTSPTNGIDGGVSDAARGYIERDGLYVLFTGSPLVDAGANVAWMGTAADLDGQSRVANGTVDIGPLEYTAAGFACPFTADVYRGLDAFDATLTAHPSGDTNGIVYYWDLDGDDTTDESGSGKAVVTAHFATPGVATATLCATNGAGLGATWSYDFTVDPSTLYVVPGAKNPQKPYATWATAAASIHDAVSTAVPGATVVLSNGTHALASRTLTLSKGITVKGVTGDWNDVKIDAQSNCRAVYINNGAARLSGVTVMRGRVYYSAAGVFIDGGGTLCNCRVTANTAIDNTAKGSGVYSVNGTVLDCVMDNNGYSGTPAGSGLFQTGATAFADRCVITNNYASSVNTGAGSGIGLWMNGGIVRNCLIAKNRLTTSSALAGNYATGATVEGGRLENCSIVGNYYGTAAQTLAFGLFAKGGCVLNTLIADNDGADARNWVVSGSPVLSNCCTTSASTLPGGQHVEATARAYTLDAGRISFKVDSPCYSGGVNLPWMESATDLYGNPRRFSAHVDIGCFELQQGAGTYLLLR